MSVIADPRGFKSLKQLEAELAEIEAGDEAALEPLPEFSEQLDNVLVVDNLPKASGKKADKLKKVLKKLLSGGKKNANAPKLEIDMPVDEEKGKTKGFAFVTFPDAASAAAAAKAYDGFALDKKHTFAVNVFSDFETLANYDETYVPPTDDEVEATMPKGVGENLQYYVCDPRGRDQFALRFADSVSLGWYDKLQDPVAFDERVGWSDGPVLWSPKGSYMLSFHSNSSGARVGVAMWGGPESVQIRRFPHPGVSRVSWSPCERFLITYSNEIPEAAQGVTETFPLVMWDVSTGLRLKTFNPPPAPDGRIPWPLFQWSSDGCYFARTSSKGVNVYQTPSCDVYRKFTIRGISGFTMSPRGNLLAAWVPENGQIPARVGVYDIATGHELRQKNLFQVKNIRMFWQKSGKYLCVQVNRTTKSGKTVFTNLEVFRLKAKHMPVETIKFDSNIVLQFAFEPRGDRFAIIHGVDTEVARPDVSFYTLEKNKVKQTLHLAAKSFDRIFWSPKGTYVVLAALRSNSGKLEFWDAAQGKQLNVQEHFMCTDVEWDPTGRHVASSVSYLRHQMENGYRVWTFAGDIQQTQLVDRLYQFLWRPRPDLQLTKAQKKELFATLPQKAAEYERMDVVMSRKVDSAAREQRRDAFESYHAFREAAAARAEEIQARLAEIRAPVAAAGDEWEDDYELIEELIEAQVVVDPQ